jgi:hypothetical protein
MPLACSMAARFATISSTCSVENRGASSSDGGVSAMPPEGNGGGAAGLRAATDGDMPPRLRQLLRRLVGCLRSPAKRIRVSEYPPAQHSDSGTD